MSPLFPPPTSLFSFGLLFLGGSFWLLSFSWILLPGIFFSSLSPFPGVLATRMPLSSLFWVSVPFPSLSSPQVHSCISFLYDSDHLVGSLLVSASSVASLVSPASEEPITVFLSEVIVSSANDFKPLSCLLFSSVDTTLFHSYGNPRRAPRVPVPQKQLSERHYWSLCLGTLPACIPAYFPTCFLSFWSKMSWRHRLFLVSPSLDMSTNRKANDGHTLIHNSFKYNKITRNKPNQGSEGHL